MRYVILILNLLLTLPALAQDENNSPEQAQAISLGGDYQETLESADDVDFFKLSSTSQEGNLTITLSQDTVGTDSESGWKLEFLIEQEVDKSIQSLQTLTLPQTELSKQLQQFISKGKYYLKVSSLNGNVPSPPYTLQTHLAVTAENNDVAEKASAFLLNRTYKELLYSAADTDYFLLDSRDKEGELTLTLGHEESSGSASDLGWRLEFFAEGNLAQSLQTVTLSQADTSAQLQQTLAKGKYYLKVSSLNGASFPIEGYNLKGVLAVATEDNDTPEGAKKISIKSKNTEALYFAGDLDFFRFDVSKDRNDPTRDTSGNLTVTLSQKAPPGANAKSGWQVDLYTENDLGNSLYTVKLPETSLSVKFEQGLAQGRYYYKVSSLNEKVFPTKEYTLQGAWEEELHYERTPNEMPHTATAIKLNETYFGNLSSPDDLDFYRFALLNPDLVTIQFQQTESAADATVKWKVGLFSENDLENPLQTTEMPITDLAAALQTNLESGVYYIRVIASLPPVEATENADTTDDTPKEDTEATASEEPAATKTQLPTALVGRRYQLVAQAANSGTTSPCSLAATYAQNPTTQRWVAFPSPCDVPAGWVATPSAPFGFEVCPAQYATLTADGVLTLPLVDAADETGKALGIFAVKLRQVPSDPLLPLRFEVMTDSLLLVRTP